MLRYFFSFATALSIAFLAGCASLSSVSTSGAPVLLEVGDLSTGTMQTRPAVAQVGGEPVLLYASKDNRVVLQRGAQKMTLDDTAPVRGGNRFQLRPDGTQIHALWWSHEGAKRLYFTSTDDGGHTFAPVSIVNDGKGVLAPFSLLRGPQGVLGMTYADERLPKYEVFFNRSLDGGRTWTRPDLRLDTPPADGGASNVDAPQTVESGSNWVSVWVDETTVEGRHSYRIMSRRSADSGASWLPEQVLYSTEKQASSLVVRASGAHIVAVFSVYQTGVMALHSDDHGSTWRQIGLLKGSEDATNSGIELAIGGKRAHLVWMQQRPNAKTTIQRASLDLVQNGWQGSAQRLDIKAFDNTMSMVPTVIALPDDSAVAAWVDYRDIRPGIYLSASFDAGQTWSSPRPVLQPGSVSAGWPELLPWGDEVALGYETYPSEDVLGGHFVLRLLPVASARALPDFGHRPPPTEEERKRRLEQRVNALWQARLAGDYSTAYDIFDFAYRAWTPKKTYLEDAGVITYLGFKTEDLTVNGNEATTKVKIKYEVKPVTLASGRQVKLAPVEVDATMAWVWVGDDWYLMYNPAFGQPMLKY